jgi:hypothetical protein
MTIKKDRRRKHDIDFDAFVREWTIANSIDEVCTRLNLPRHTVNATRKRLIDAGVNLKEMRAKTIDVERLNNIIGKTEKT